MNKFKNIRSDGGAVSDPNKSFSDVDFPVFRLPEMYFIYAEAFLRGGAGANTTDAIEYMNKIRRRSLNIPNPEIYASDFTLNYVLNERGRELYWEGHRRTDLIRYGLLTSGTYVWPWKGGVASGTGVDSKYNLFPIPSEFRNTNTNLEQNTGY